MKILICTDSFYPGIGGTEAACLGFASELTRQGHKVLLASPHYPQKDSRKYDFEVLRLPSLSITKNDKMVLLKFSKSEIKYIKDFKPDIIHIESVSGMAKLGLRLGKELRVPTVMTIHTKFRDAFSRYIKSKLIVNKALKNIGKKLNSADRVITVVDNIKDEIRTWGFCGEITVIKNGAMFAKDFTSESEKIEIRKELKLDQDENYLLFVGRMFKYKNIEFIIRSFKIAKEKGFRGKFILVGDGRDLKYFQKLVRKLNLEQDVIFTGQINDRTSVAKYYKASDLFITASKFDTDPIIVVEAACLGLPSLVIEGSGCSSRISDNLSGYTCKENNELFAKKIIEIFDDKTSLQKIGKNAIELVPSTWEDNVNEHLEIYKSLINHK